MKDSRIVLFNARANKSDQPVCFSRVKMTFNSTYRFISDENFTLRSSVIQTCNDEMNSLKLRLNNRSIPRTEELYRSEGLDLENSCTMILMSACSHWWHREKCTLEWRTYVYRSTGVGAGGGEANTQALACATEDTTPLESWWGQRRSLRWLFARLRVPA